MVDMSPRRTFIQQLAAGRVYIDKAHFLQRGSRPMPNLDGRCMSMHCYARPARVLLITNREPEISTTNLLQLPPKLDHTPPLDHVPPRSATFPEGRRCVKQTHTFLRLVETSGGVGRQCIFRAERPSYGINAVCPRGWTLPASRIVMTEVHHEPATMATINAILLT